MNGRVSNKSQALVLALFVVFLSSCHRKEERPAHYEPFNEEPAQAEPLQNSGNTLSGSYVVAAAQDPYAAQDQSHRLETSLNFDGAGQFKREVVRDGAVIRREKGSYVIGSRREFVLYVEEVGGELLPSARIEQYKLADQSENRIVLERSPGSQMVLQRK